MENSMTYVLNCYLVMGDFIVGTMFTQPLAGNGHLWLTLLSSFVGQNVDKLSCVNYVSYFSYHRPILGTTDHQAPQLTVQTKHFG
jgi:hypothetical protein